MLELAQKLTPGQECDVSNEVERLFVLQDRPLSKKKLAIYVLEIGMMGYPFKAVMAGIRSLVNRELTNIKFHVICEAIKSFIQEEKDSFVCEHCDQSGNVPAKREDGYSFALPCVCKHGEMLAKHQELRQWNGKRIMISSNGMKMIVHSRAESN